MTDFVCPAFRVPGPTSHEPPLLPSTASGIIGRIHSCSAASLGF